jgi:endonuclease III
MNENKFLEIARMENTIAGLNTTFFSDGFRGEKPEIIKAADDLLHDLKNTPHAFVLGCVIDRQDKADRVWLAPYKLFNIFLKDGYIKNNSIDELVKVKQEKYNEVFEKYNLHRFNKTMASIFCDAVWHIKKYYNSDASKIWTGKPSSGEIIMRFSRFKGIGQKISTMAANILVRKFNIPLSDYKHIDMSLDTHIMTILPRLGFVENNLNEGELKEAILTKTRKLNPDFPGVYDRICFKIGRAFCHKINPLCNQCLLKDICEKNT